MCSHYWTSSSTPKWQSQDCCYRVLGDFVHQKGGVKIVVIAKGGDFVELQLTNPCKASLSFPP